MIALPSAVRSARRALWLWNWRGNTRNRPQPTLNAWGYPDVGYW
jgi:hypothetical protein